MDFGRLLLRLVIGLLFVGHGTQKLLGWFGGGGLDATSQNFEKLGFTPGRRNALAAGATEAAGGAALAAGLATPLAAAGLISVMVTAVRTIHWKNGVWNTKGGFEYNAVLVAALLSLAGGGPGRWSLDHALGLDRAGLAWLLAALALGSGGSYGATALAHRYAAQAEPAPVETRPPVEDTEAAAA